MMNTAVVILNWNGLEMLRRYLPSVIRHTANDARIIVADNGSDDDSIPFLRERYPEVEIIALDRNYGFAGGYNRALQMVKADCYVLLNSDVRVTAGWLQPLTTYMTEHPEVAACQPKIMADTAPEKFEYAGACGGMLDRYGYAYCRGRVFDTVETDTGQYDDVANVDWATGACLMIRARDFHAENGFDERFFAHFEEVDLCWRLRIRGRGIVCIPLSRVFHLGGGTLPQGNPRKTFLNFRNNLTMLYKCLPRQRRECVMRTRCLLDYAAACKALIIDRRPADFKAICQARRAFNKWKHDFDKDARILQERQADANPPLPYNKLSILWQYYAKGRKTYSRLV